LFLAQKYTLKKPVFCLDNGKYLTNVAERLFERDFPDLFEWIVNQMGELPLAKMGRKSSSDNLLNLQSVPA